MMLELVDHQQTDMSLLTRSLLYCAMMSCVLSVNVIERW